jgi:hypothetical protein
MKLIKNESPIIGRVCKHAYLSFNKHNRDNDLLTAKITNIHEDGSRSHQLWQIPDYKRDFYIVKKKHQNFKDKRDYIEISKCDKFTSNESRLALNISKALFGRPDRSAQLTELKNNQFVFGCQETVPVVYKEKFYRKYADFQNTEAYAVGAYDVETYIRDDGGTGAINMASTTHEDYAFWAGLRSYFPKEDRHDDAIILRKLKAAEEKHLADYIKLHNVTIDYKLVDTSGQVVYENVQYWHRSNVDFIVSWNANFDMKANEEALKNECYDLAQVYSDPEIPSFYQHYKYYPGREFKTKVDGTQTPLENQERFPVVQAPARWQWFDGMSFYAIKRAPQGKKESYSLQNTSKAEGVDGKLYIPEAAHLQEGSAEWHKFMVENFPYEYVMYNIRDNWVIEDLNRQTNDYSLSLPSLVTSSELGSYQSQPSMISDKLSFIAMDHGYVWGTVGRRKENPWKEITPDLRDWIALLHAELNENKGKAIYSGLGSWRSMGRGATDDIDVTGAYPHVTVSLNVSNKTTKVEVCEIEGLDRIEFRRLGVNYASSPTANAVTLCNTIFGMPQLTDINSFYEDSVVPFLKEAKEDLKKAA